MVTHATPRKIPESISSRTFLDRNLQLFTANIFLWSNKKNLRSSTLESTDILALFQGPVSL